MVLLYYVLGHLSLLALVFLGGYIIGTNRGFSRLNHHIMRRCDHRYEVIDGIGICIRCGHIKEGAYERM